MNKDLEKLSNESFEDYKQRLFSNKLFYGLTWYDVADLLNNEQNSNYSADKYRKEFRDHSRYKAVFDDENDVEEFKSKVKLSDQKTQIKSLYRLIAREETFKEIAEEVAQELVGKKLLEPIKNIKVVNKEKKAILCIGDWHYGLEVDLYYNKYNTEIAKERVAKLLEISLCHIKEHNIDDLYVINLGDMISGRIHLPLRINSRIDAVQQTIEVSELIAEFLSNLSCYTHVNYIDVSDNHSRVEPNKKESLQTEAFSRIITWFLKERLSSNKNITFIDNDFSTDFAVFKVFSHQVVAVHGDKDSQNNIINTLTAYLQHHIDILISAHKHHFSANENDYTEHYCNGSLIGQETHASNLRLVSHPSQLLFICTPDNVSEILYKIKL